MSPAVQGDLTFGLHLHYDGDAELVSRREGGGGGECGECGDVSASGDAGGVSGEFEGGAE